MRIQHNIMAMNAYRNYTSNTSALSKNLEKLSSGYRINRAGDDAAGLAISEKMRAQITGLKTAQKNAKDGISLVQTAEGALTEVHDMLNRMAELADQSANGTIDNETDRANLQKEIVQLQEEIDRIADSSNFNGINLLDGSLDAGSAAGAGKPGSATGDITVETDIANVALKTNQQGTAAVTGVYSFNVSGALTGDGLEFTTDALQFTVTYKDANGDTKTKTLYAANDTTAIASDSTKLASAMVAAITGDAELSKLFDAAVGTGADASKIDLTAKEAGTNAGQLLGISLDRMAEAATPHVDSGTATDLQIRGSVDVATKTAAADATKVDVIDFGTTNPTTGDTITIGDTTYEFVGPNGDVYGVGSGNKAVVVGANVNDSVKNLVEALKANGVSSASADNAKIKIGDLNQIRSSIKSADITTSNKNGIVIGSEAATKGESKFSVGATGSANQKVSLSISYLDENGEEQTTTISYTAGAAGAAGTTTSADNIKAAIEADETLSSLFKVDSTTGVITLTSKNAGTKGATVTGLKSGDADPTSIKGLVQTVAGRNKGQSISLDANQMASGDTLTVDGKTFQFVTKDNMDSVKDGNIAVLLDKDSTTNTAANMNMAIKQAGITGIEYNAATSTFFVEDGKGLTSSGGLTLQIGDTGEDFNQLTVSIKDMHAKSMGVGDLDIGTQKGAQAAIDVIKSAINYVSDVRGTLGATQNRLEHTINNLSVMQENIQDAESSIRDVDVADEMMNYTKNNILIQSAQAMLAQANQVPQGVLQLLQ